jgi:hypothetical protein
VASKIGGIKMFPEEKLSAVRNYLKSEFPDYAVDDQYDFDRVAWTFRLTLKDKIHLVTVAREFIDDHTPSEISNILQKHPLSQHFRQAKVARIVIRNSGIKPEEK